MLRTTLALVVHLAKQYLLVNQLNESRRKTLLMITLSVYALFGKKQAVHLTSKCQRSELLLDSFGAFHS